MASSNPLTAWQRLDRLKELRMRGQAPWHAIVVVTQRQALQEFEDMRLPTIEVWTGILDRLDWRPVAGLDVVAMVHWRGLDDRMRLFDAIREGRPRRLHWIATTPGGAPRQCRYTTILEDGEVWQPSDLELFEKELGGIYGRV